MRMLVTGVAFLLAVAGCSETIPWRTEAAAAIGDELAGQLAGPLARAAETAHDTDADPVMKALSTALDEMAVPAGVQAIVLGSHSSSTFGGGYAGVSLPLVVVPIDGGDMFCMVFALSTTGELVAEPASGDPVDRCANTNSVRLAERQRLPRFGQHLDQTDNPLDTD